MTERFLELSALLPMLTPPPPPQFPTCSQTTLGELAFLVELTFGNSQASLFSLQAFQSKVESLLYVQMLESFVF